MKVSISQRMGIIVGLTLVISLSIMIFILLNREENQKKSKALDSVQELSESLRESLIFSMAAGVSDINPFIEKAKKIKSIKELRITPSDLIKSGSENFLDEKEKNVISQKIPQFYTEKFNGSEVCRSIELIVADESCTSCHTVEKNSPMAVMSLRYSMEKDYKAIANARLNAILMSLGTIVITFLVVMFFIKRNVLKDLIISVNDIKRMAVGNLNETHKNNRVDELGVLSNSLCTLQNSLKQHSETAVKISQGNLDCDISVLSPDDVLGKAMITVKDSVKELLKDIKSISSAVKEGNLDKRADANKHSGDFNKIIAGCYDILDAI